MLKLSIHPPVCRRSTRAPRAGPGRLDSHRARSDTESVSAPLSAPRLFTLRSPVTTEEGRTLLQTRLSTMLLVVFVLGFSFWLLQLLTTAFGVGTVHDVFATHSVGWQLGTIFGALALSFIVRRGRPGVIFLDYADATSTVLICWGWTIMVHADGLNFQRPELVALLAVSYTLALRAALVPSTAARTALIGLLSLVPLIPATIDIHRRTDAPGVAVGMAVYVGIWAAIGVSCISTISHVIHGLQRQMRRALQLGQYVLEEKIGEGGMGVVYRASHALLRRPTAIKLLARTTESAARRFEREVQITARLTHPNTVSVFDYGRTPDGLFYYAMEYLDGVTLQDLVDELGPLPPPRAVHVLRQICGALAEAHDNGLVHRDIKPANVMLAQRGGMLDFVKVLDFGLVKEANSEDLKASTASVVVGTPHYLAPEAVLDPRHVDARTDLYALGATAFFLLTGSPVFQGRSVVELCGHHLHTAAEFPHTERERVPEPLQALVLSCLAKKPDQRPASANQLAAQLLSSGVETWSQEQATAWWATAAAQALQMRIRARATSVDGNQQSNVTIELGGRNAA